MFMRGQGGHQGRPYGVTEHSILVGAPLVGALN